MNFSKITIILLLVNPSGTHCAAAGVNKEDLNAQFLKVCLMDQFVEKDHKEEAQRLLVSGAEINYSHAFGTTLCYVIDAIMQKNHSEFWNAKGKSVPADENPPYLMKNLEFLINNEADVNNIGRKDKRSALQFAVSGATRHNLVKLLLQSGTDLEHKDSTGVSILDWSLAGVPGRDEIVEAREARKKAQPPKKSVVSADLYE